MAQHLTHFMITGVNIATPAAHETGNDGVSLLTFGFFADKYVGGKGKTAHFRKQYFRCTIWRRQADYLWAIIQEFGGKDGKPGVGMKISVESDSIPVSSAYIRKVNGQDERDANGELVISHAVELTVTDFVIESDLPDGALNRAARASRFE